MSRIIHCRLCNKIIPGGPFCTECQTELYRLLGTYTGFYELVDQLGNSKIKKLIQKRQKEDELKLKSKIAELQKEADEL